ncbi:PrsW family intramembrane metalloprotease [Solirubrobacter taibaiensis]|nr:PrsW family intramembrane metalloprotease [Solirubrobacter taibaiensis]
MSGVTAPAVTQEQLARRDAAIATSGWGRPFRLLQPRNLAFWVWAAGVIFGVWSALQLFSPQAPVAGEALTVGALVAAGFGAVLWLFFKSIDRYDRLPVLLLVSAFLWGGFAATYGMAILANSANMELLAKLIGQGFESDWGAGLSAPIVEETSKGVGFLLFFTLAPAVLHSPRAALITGAFIGLGFQILEDDLYSLQGAAGAFYADQAGAVLQTAVVRIATGLISHAAYTGIFCVGLLYVLGTPAVKRNVPKGLLFMLIAMTIHGTWDAAAAIADGNGFGTIGALLFSSVLALVALLWAFRLSQPLEQQWMRDILAPEVAAGHVTTEEIDAAAGRRKHRKAFEKATHGHRAHKHARHVLEAVIDLAHELAASGGKETPSVQYARAEVVRLRA